MKGRLGHAGSSAALNATLTAEEATCHPRAISGSPSLPIMGKHGEKKDCSACSGSGKQQVGENGSVREVPCVVCNGTGKV